MWRQLFKTLFYNAYKRRFNDVVVLQERWAIRETCRCLRGTLTERGLALVTWQPVAVSSSARESTQLRRSRGGGGGSRRRVSVGSRSEPGKCQRALTARLKSSLCLSVPLARAQSARFYRARHAARNRAIKMREHGSVSGAFRSLVQWDLGG